MNCREYQPKHLKQPTPMTFWKHREGKEISVVSNWEHVLQEHPAHMGASNALVRSVVEKETIEKSQPSRGMLPISVDQWGYSVKPQAIALQSSAVHIIEDDKPTGTKESFAGASNSTYGFIGGSASADIVMNIG